MEHLYFIVVVYIKRKIKGKYIVWKSSYKNEK